MVTKRTRNKSKRASLRLQLLILENRQNNLSQMVADQFMRMSLIIGELQSEIRKLMEDSKC